MIGNRRGPWIETFTGKQFHPWDPRISDICIEDIAHALSQLCRFCGHCKKFYSVSEHCVAVSKLLMDWFPHNRDLHIAGLLHDGSEAYCADMPKPLKDHPDLAGYKALELSVLDVVFDAFAVDRSLISHKALHEADRLMGAIEARELVPGLGDQLFSIPEIMNLFTRTKFSPNPQGLYPEQARDLYLSHARTIGLI